MRDLLNNPSAFNNFQVTMGAKRDDGSPAASLYILECRLKKAITQASPELFDHLTLMKYKERYNYFSKNIYKEDVLNRIQRLSAISTHKVVSVYNENNDVFELMCMLMRVKRDDQWLNNLLNPISNDELVIG